jgi:hypothetical protein
MPTLGKKKKKKKRGVALASRRAPSLVVVVPRFSHLRFSDSNSSAMNGVTSL